MQNAPGTAPDARASGNPEETVNGLAPHPDAARAVWVVDLRSRRVVRQCENLAPDDGVPAEEAGSEPAPRELLAAARER